MRIVISCVLDWCGHFVVILNAYDKVLERD